MTTLEKALRGAVISGIFALPFIALYVASGLFFPYITGKNFLFRVIVEVITALWLTLALVFPKYRPRHSLILGAFALFIAIIALADAHGVYPFKSFWSNYERMDGWVTIAHLFAYLVVTASVMTTEKLWRRLFKLSLGLSVYFALYGYAQMAGVAALGQGGAAGFSARIDATFGNPIYLAVYMLFNIFLAAMLWMQSWEVRKPGKRLWPSLAYGAIIIVDMLALVFTGTRGTVLGLIGGALVSAFLMAIFLKHGRVRMGAIGLLMGVLVIVAGFWSIRQTALVQDVGFLHRLATISTTDTTVQARFMNWGIAWQGVKERPVLGWGQENYAIVFDKYYDPGMYAQEQWFDRVHNIIFDWLVAGGFLGLLAYLSIFAAILWALWRSGGFTVAERSILTGLLAGYFFHNLFVFDNVTSYILFGTVAAFIAYRAAQAQKAPYMPERILVPPSALPGVAIASVVLAVGMVWVLNADAYAANRALINAIAPQQGGVAQNLEYFKKSIGYGTYGMQEAREQLAQGATQLASVSSVSVDVKKDFLDTAATQMLLQEKASPLDARFPLFLGSLYDTYGMHGEAKAALERALALSPKKQTILFQLAANAQSRGDTDAMISYFKQAYELDTSYIEATGYYVAALIQNKKDAQADELVVKMIEDDTAAVPRIAASYILRGNLAKPLAIWRAHLAKHPEDTQSSVSLAAAYYQSGHPAQSVQALQDAADANPQAAPQLQQLIQAVRSGAIQVQ